MLMLDRESKRKRGLKFVHRNNEFLFLLIHHHNSKINLMK